MGKKPGSVAEAIVFWGVETIVFRRSQLDPRFQLASLSGFGLRWGRNRGSSSEAIVFWGVETIVSHLHRLRNMKINKIIALLIQVMDIGLIVIGIVRLRIAVMQQPFFLTS